MLTVAAIAGVLVLGALAVFQALLAAGAPLGRFAWGGQHVVLPTRLRVGSAISIVLYALFAVLILQAADLVSVLPDRVATVGIWALAVYLVLGVVLNGISRSRSERFVMTPVVLLLAVISLALALR